MNTPSSFHVFPAIDLRDGQVVRLKEGDPNRQTSYSADPAATARRWIDLGTRRLHVVNLDGAFDQPDQANKAALSAILAEARQGNIPVQFGGGLRSAEAVDRALDLGVSRVMIGTLAVEQPQVFADLLAKWGPNRIGASLDARDGLVQVRGWQSATALPAVDLARTLADSGLRWLVFTDIARDGLQTGLNLTATAALAAATGLNVIASGGVSRIEDVQASKAAGLAGCIVGRALYEGNIEPEQLFRMDNN